MNFGKIVKYENKPSINTTLLSTDREKEIDIIKIKI